MKLGNTNPVERQIASDLTQITNGKAVLFQSQRVKENFLKAYGVNWQKVVKSVLEGQPDGTYEVFPGNTGWRHILGSICVDSEGDYYIKAHSGLCRDAFLAEVSPQFIRSISGRILEIFGKDGMDGNWQEYDWLEKTYGITYEEDNKWLDLLQFYDGTLEQQPSFELLDESERNDILVFTRDKEANFAFLIALEIREQ